jgi:hypothetical protein
MAQESGEGMKANPRNPNRMADDDKARMVKSLAEFGDLGGIVINRRTGLLIGGHQRTSVMPDGKLCVTDLPKPEPDGTVARGHLDHKGRMFSVRVVDWPEEKANAAMIAANRFGRVGHDEAAILKDLLQDLDTGAFDMDLTGYDVEELERLMTQFHVTSGEAGTQRGNNPPEQERVITCPKCRYRIALQS